MDRFSEKTILAVLTLLALVIGPAYGLGGLQKMQSSDKLNVLFIAADDLGNVLSCQGNPWVQTPNLDRLASQGILFDRACNQIPLCNPSRASVMTGLRPDTIGVYDLDRHFREDKPNVKTLSQVFMEQGYVTGRVGKIYHYNVPASIGSDGFDDPKSWQFTINPKGRDKEEEKLIFNAEPHRKISAALSWLAVDGTDKEQTDGMVTSEAIGLIEKFKEESFFLGVGFFRPHTPYVAPKKYFDLYPLNEIRLPWAPTGDRKDIPLAAFAHNCPLPNYNLDEKVLRKAIQAYYACVTFIDAQIGRLIDALEKSGLSDKTLIVFWSDHGYHLGEHMGIWQKRTLFEESARSPLIISMPGVKANGQICQRVVEFIDIYPTVVDLAGLPMPAHLEGRSLKPLISNPMSLWDGFAVTQILRPSDSRLARPVMGRSIRTARWRYTDWNSGQEGVELYDHLNDRGEFQNLAVISPMSKQIKKVIEDLKKILNKKALGSNPNVPVNPKRL